MLKIAHRGNTNGANPALENSPDYLVKAIDSGFDVEIDVWVISGEIFFGHDEPTWGAIPERFLLEIGSKSWFHCKNIEALHFLNTTFPQLAYFWHETDSYTLTSNGYIWTYPGEQPTPKSIIVSFESHIPAGDYYGICSDHVAIYS